MKKFDSYNFSGSGIHKYVSEHIKALPDLLGKKVLDIPCGDGRSSYEFKKRGAKITALDLFPGFMKVSDLSARYADLSEALPIKTGTIDYIICQEGIEHIPNQLYMLQEFNRVLKKNGILLITTPNYSHVRARLSHFLFETDFWKRMPPTEIDSIWFSEKNTEKLYFGHIFLLGAQHLQTLVEITGFKVKKRIKTDIGNTSIILGFAVYPFLVLFTLLSYWSYRNKNSHIEKKARKRILWERVKLNLSPKTLFYKHMFWELQKKDSLDEVVVRLKNMKRK